MSPKVIGLLALVAAVILVIYGLNASDSLGSEVNEVLTGNPTDRAMWLMIGGAVLGVLGLVLLARGGRTADRAI